MESAQVPRLLRKACYFGEEDYLVYPHGLDEALKESGCALHAYGLMTNPMQSSEGWASTRGQAPWQAEGGEDKGRGPGWSSAD